VENLVDKLELLFGLAGLAGDKAKGAAAIVCRLNLAVDYSGELGNMPPCKNKQKQIALRSADMRLKLWITLAIFGSSAALSGCVPLLIAGAGAGAVIAADSHSEKKKGGDGLF